MSTTETTRPRVLVVVNAETSGPRRLTPWLEEDGIDPHVVLGKDGLPDSLDGYAGLVMLGGGLMPDDDEKAPWLPDERRLARAAVEADLPTLGICLGGQILAHIGGGEVRAEYGHPERGSTRITPTEEGRRDPVLSTLGEVAPMIQHHVDQMTRIPEGAVLLATSEKVENQAFRLGRHVRGLQFHPEASKDSVARWNPEEMARKGEDHARLVADAEADHEENTAASRALVRAFADEVHAAARGTGTA